MYLHKIRLEKGNQAFSGRTLGNSLTWSVTYDGEGGLTLLHRSGREFSFKVTPPAYLAVDISDPRRPRVEPVKRPKNPRRALLWGFGFRRRNRLSEKRTWRDYGYYLNDNIHEWGSGATSSSVPFFHWENESLFLIVIPEARGSHHYVKEWWMAPWCTLKEAREALSALERCYPWEARCE